MPPVGKLIPILAVLACITGAAVLTQPSPPHSALTVWVYSDDEANTFRAIAPDSVRVDLIAPRVLDARLISLFMSPAAGLPVPDLVEIDLASVGKFFRPPPADIGLLPLNGFLSASGQLPRFVPARLIPWSKHGIIFGIPRDVHPVTLAYRADLFDQAGVDLDAPRTWPQFQVACLRFQHYWSEHGYPQRRAMELYSSQSEELVLMLLQRHINLVDGNDAIHLTDPTVAETVAFYAQLVAGPRRIAADTVSGTPFGYRDLADGGVCAMLTPDWRTRYLRQYAPELARKLRMRALPVFDSTDSPTSTWGGTMIGIPRQAKDPAAAWRLLVSLCLSKPVPDMIPPLPEFWADSIYQQPDPFFGGQQIDRLYTSLAGQIPTRYVSPFSLTAQGALTLVMNKAVAYAEDHGRDGLETACTGWLTDAAAELQQWVRHGDMER
jgi:arabinosaccharide transport system substrate-binding protein